MIIETGSAGLIGSETVQFFAKQGLEFLLTTCEHNSLVRMHQPMEIIAPQADNYRHLHNDIQSRPC